MINKYKGSDILLMCIGFGLPEKWKSHLAPFTVFLLVINLATQIVCLTLKWSLDIYLSRAHIRMFSHYIRDDSKLYLEQQFHFSSYCLDRMRYNICNLCFENKMFWMAWKISVLSLKKPLWFYIAMLIFVLSSFIFPLWDHSSSFDFYGINSTIHLFNHM